MTRSSELVSIYKDRMNDPCFVERLRVVTSTNIASFLVAGLSDALNESALDKIITRCIKCVNVYLGQLIAVTLRRGDTREPLLCLATAWRNLVLYLSLLPPSLCLQYISTLHDKFHSAEEKGVHMDQAVAWLETVAKSVFDKQEPSSLSPRVVERPLYGAEMTRPHWLLASR